MAGNPDLQLNADYQIFLKPHMLVEARHAAPAEIAVRKLLLFCGAMRARAHLLYLLQSVLILLTMHIA